MNQILQLIKYRLQLDPLSRSGMRTLITNPASDVSGFNVLVIIKLIVITKLQCTIFILNLNT